MNTRWISLLCQGGQSAQIDRDHASMTVHEAVEQIYERERENIYSYVLYHGISAHRAQELTQDSFLKLYQKMSKGEPIDNPRAWLYRVAHNFALRVHEREPVLDELDLDSNARSLEPDVENMLINRQRRAALEQAMRGLSPQQRQCLHLRVEGLRYREIADVVGISSSAVGEFLRRAATRLKEAMNGWK